MNCRSERNILSQTSRNVPSEVHRWQPLSRNRAEVWWFALADMPNEVWSDWLSALDDEERSRAARFVHDHDRRQFIAAHAMLRGLLQRLAGKPAAEWKFAIGSRGKPALHPDHGMDRLNFNISHTRGAVACAMTLDHPIGVDIEHVERPGRLLEIANSYFAPDELAILHAAPEAEQRTVFFRLWTLKEAYIKARGDGLHLQLDLFAFSLSPPRIAFAPGLADDPVRWHFSTMTPTPEHLLSVAVCCGRTLPVAVAPHRMTHLDIGRLVSQAEAG